MQEFIDLINAMNPGSRNLKGRNPKKNPKVLVKRASDSPAPPLQHENNSCGLQPQGEERGGNTFPAGSVILGKDGCAPRPDLTATSYAKSVQDLEATNAHVSQGR